MSAAKTLEVHEHCFVRGPRATASYSNGFVTKFSHSHADGNRAHGHPDTGPAAFTIDKDDWYRRTGLRGGGRKTFTVKPTGEQFPIEELTEAEKTFTVIVGNPTPREWGTGPGIALPLRMVLGFGMRCVVKDGRA